MGSFVRKNKLVLSGTFTASDGSATAPSTVTANLAYTNTGGSPAQASVVLTLGADGVTWSGSWDSSVALIGQASQVNWVVYTAGALVAAAEGTFTLAANSANVI